MLENLKLDRWYGIVLYLGVALIAASLLFKPKFIEQKHVFGLGIGMIIIGIAYIMSEKYWNKLAIDGMLSTKINKHSFITKTMIVIGLALVVLFGFLLVKGLI
tara:strand:- start:164 stop:472 length:309 start_codon:yes stop_codon:yes gene_type:complete